MIDVLTTGHPLSIQRIREAEQSLGVTLPQDYIDFLLKSNGGTIWSRGGVFETPEFAGKAVELFYVGEKEAFSTFEMLYPLCDPLENDPALFGDFKTDVIAEATDRRLNNMLPSYLLPIGRTSSECDLLLSCHESAPSRVYGVYWAQDGEGLLDYDPDFDPRKLFQKLNKDYRLANSFSDFWAALKWEKLD